MAMHRDPTEFRARFKAYKEGKMPYENGLPKYRGGKVNWPRWDDAQITSYTIPFIEDKAIKLTDAGRATGAVLSTNLLDSLADNAMRAGIPVRTAIGLATKESTLGNPTDDRSAWNLSSRIRKQFNEVYPGTVQHINDGTNLVDGIKLINYHKGDINHEMFNGAQGKSIIQEGLEFYKTHPDKYNPGQKGYQKAVDARGDEVMNSPEIKKWYKEWEAKQMKIMRPKSYKIETNIQNTATPKFGSWKNGKLPRYGGGKIPYVASDGTQYNIDPDVVGSDQINITIPDVVVTGTDRRPMYQRYDAENSTYDPNAVRMFTDWAPIISDVGDGLDAYNAFKNKDWSQFGIIAGAALLPNVIEKALQPVQRFVQPIAKRYISPLVDKYISPTMDRLFSNTKQLSLPSSETSQRITDDDFNFDFSPSLEDSRATAVRNATEQSVLDAFDSRLPYAKNTNGPLVRAVPATMENNKKLVDHFLQQIKEKYPGVSDEEAKKLFEQIHEASVDDVLYARGMTVRDPVTHEVKFVSYNNQGNNTRSAATKTHEENHTLYDLSPDRFQHHTVTVLDSPLGVKKNYLNEEAGYSLPKNISNPNDYDGVEEYLSADEVSSFMSEAKSLLGKTEDEALTEGDIKWFIKNHNIIGDRLQQRSVYKSIAEHITNAKKFAQWCNDYSNVVAALAIGGAATAAATIPEYADGKLPGYKNGKIHIKPANRGKFTALKKRTGHSASWFKENGTPAQKKMAVFALNSRITE